MMGFNPINDETAAQRMIATCEPTAEIREMASAMKQFYVALRQEGFTNRQALYIVTAGFRSEPEQKEDS